MPIHDYKCLECQTPFEVFYQTQSAVKKEEPKEKCPKCDSVKKQRLISKGTSFQLKGPGWAKDKYGK